MNKEKIQSNYMKHTNKTKKIFISEMQSTNNENGKTNNKKRSNQFIKKFINQS